jgi:hypothetical protein
MFAQKSKRIFLIAAVVLLNLSACRNSFPSVPLKTVNQTSLMTVTKNINPLQSIPITDFFLPPASCNNSQYLKDITIKDGTPIDPGTTFVKKWIIKNTGSCGWTRRYSLQFASGERMSGETTYLEKWVPPGQVIVISLELSAPQTEGTHTGYWILTDGYGEPFGNYIYVSIVV